MESRRGIDQFLIDGISRIENKIDEHKDDMNEKFNELSSNLASKVQAVMLDSARHETEIKNLKEGIAAASQTSWKVAGLVSGIVTLFVQIIMWLKKGL